MLISEIIDLLKACPFMAIKVKYFRFFVNSRKFVKKILAKIDKKEERPPVCLPMAGLPQAGG